MSYDVVVIGAGIVGAACAHFAAAAGLSVCVIDRGPLAGGTTGAGEGNLLVSDKEPGAELDLALLSGRIWRGLAPAPVAATTVGERIELEQKGGLVVASSPPTMTALRALADQQRAEGIDSSEVAPGELASYEPNISRDLAGGFFYPQDMQVQPMLATATLLKLTRDAGGTVLTGESVVELLRDGERIVGVRTDRRRVAAGAVINAAGTWAGDVAALAGVHLPVAPRRGFILVTEPLPVVVHHKVYFADYVADVTSDSAALQSSPVVEGTRSGTVLIGATRERVGFDRSWSPTALRLLSAGAIRLFPFLAGVAILRAYRGFRPYCPDHLPVVGADPRAPGLWHACGHEGAGIGLAAGTGHLIAQALTGSPTDIALHPFRPERFDLVAA